MYAVLAGILIAAAEKLPEEDSDMTDSRAPEMVKLVNSDFTSLAVLAADITGERIECQRKYTRAVLPAPPPRSAHRSVRRFHCTGPESLELSISYAENCVAPA